MMLLAAVLVLAGVASAASVPGADMFWASASKSGGDFRLTAVADDGAAAGTLILGDKTHTRHAIYYKGTGDAFTDLSKKAGPGSVAMAINDRHQVAGFRAANKDTSTYDLIDPKVDAAHKPRAFLYSAGKVRLLAQPSYATDVNDAGVVVGNFLAADKQIHAFAWFTGGLRSAPVAAGRFLDLGPGVADTVTNPTTSSKVAVGGSVGTSAGYYSVDLATGKFTSKALPFLGEVTALNNSWRGAGFSQAAITDVSQTPVLVDLRKASHTPLAVPAPFSSAKVNTVDDAGVAFGDLFGADGALGGGKWVSGAPKSVAAQFPKSALHGATVTGVAAASFGGLLAGTGTIQSAQWTFVGYPSAADQLASIRTGVAQTGAAVFGKGTLGAIAKASAAARGHKAGAACTALEQARNANYRDARKTGFYVRGNLIQAVDEVESTLGCANKIVPARGMPFHR
jgi:hypothetical protein